MLKSGLSQLSIEAINTGDGRSVRGRIRALEHKIDVTVTNAEGMPKDDPTRKALLAHGESLREELAALETWWENNNPRKNK